MPRLRLGVVLLVPSPHDREIDGLRRALDDPQAARVAPHLTLVPPVNVRVDDVPEALRVLREAAASIAASSPLVLRLGPPATFRPATDTLYLTVGGTDEALATLHQLREALFVPPYERELEWPFVPHVTISEGIDGARIDAAVDVVAGYAIDAAFERVHVLQEQRSEDGERRWLPVADAPFERAAVVGRGGIELELSRSSIVDPEVRGALLESRDEPVAPMTTSTPASTDGLASAGAVPSGAAPLVVTARRRGQVVGLATGWTRDDDRRLTGLVVAPAERGQGISRQLRLAFDAR